MKAILVNGSRREKGCTFTALSLIAKELNAAGIDTEIYFIGKKVIDGKVDEAVKEVGEALSDADAFVVGSPVYYASPSGESQMFLDRLFMQYGKDLKFKPAAAVTSARRAGTTATLDGLNKYFMINQMPVVSSTYWNMVHGYTPEDVMKDEEGVQVMQNLGRNMAWLLQCIEAGKAAGIEHPQEPATVRTNFIR